MKNNVEKMNYDNLIIGTTPALQVQGGELYKATGSAKTIKRGTILAVVTGGAAEGKLIPLGATQSDASAMTANCILCDDVTVGTEGNEKVSVYTAGCFNLNQVIVESEHTISAADLDALRMRGIVLKAASK